MGRIIYFDIAALAILFILFVSLFFRRMYRGRINLFFISLLVVIFLNTVMDIISTLEFRFVEDPIIRNRFRASASTLYYIFRVAEGPLYFIFVANLTGTWNHLRKKKLTVLGFLLPLFVSIIVLMINLFTGAVFSFSPDGYYSRGPLVAVIYAAGVMYLLAALLLLIYTRNTMDREKFFTLAIIFPLEVIALVCQFIWKDYLLEMFSMSIVAMMVSNIVLRPEEDVDLASGARSYTAFSNDVIRSYRADLPFDVIFIRLKNNSSLISILGNEQHRELLQTISDMLRSTLSDVRPGKLNRELYYLYSGLYAITFMGKERHKNSQAEAEAIMNRLKGPFHSHHLDLDLDISVSTVHCPEDIANRDELINYANTFDRLAKDTEVAVYSQIAPDKNFRISSRIDSIIGRAMSNNSFVLYYQPIYSVKEKRFTTAEALIRLIDEKDGIISPALFIPAAEKNGTIHKIGEFVMQDVCRFIENNPLDKLGMHFIEVNLSTVQCMRNSIVDQFEQCLTTHKIKHNNISLEVTETASNFIHDTVRSNISVLHSKGFDFALDDYGTGYSNLQRFVDMPFNVIKLDKHFVDEWKHPRMRYIIENTIRMIKDLGDQIVVEGVETKEAAEWFAAQGCDYIQGFYYAKPMPEKDFLNFIRSQA